MDGQEAPNKTETQDAEAEPGDPTGIQRDCACRDWVRKAKDRVVRYMKQYRTGLCRYIVHKKKRLTS